MKAVDDFMKENGRTFLSVGDWGQDENYVPLIKYHEPRRMEATDLLGRKYSDENESGIQMFSDEYGEVPNNGQPLPSPIRRRIKKKGVVEPIKSVTVRKKREEN